MSCNGLLSAPARRSDLLALLAADPRFESQRAACVARFIAAQPEASCPVLYGCGGLGRLLAREHGAVLRRAGAVFVATRPDADNFEGFALLAPAGLSETDGPVLLLSATYAGEMRAALPAPAVGRALFLAQVLAQAVQPGDLAALEQAMEARARELAGRIAAEVPKDRPLACFLIANFGNHALPVLAGVRAAGWRVAVLTHAAARPGDEAGMLAHGQLDLLHCEASPEALRLVLGSLLATGNPFDVLHSWTSLSNHAFLADLARAGAPLVVAIDAALPPLFEGGRLGATLCAELGATREALLEDWRAIYTQAAGIISKDSPGLDQHFERELGLRPRRVLYLLPPVGPAPARRPAVSAGGPVRVAFIGSLHRSARREDLSNMADFMDMVRQFTSRGISLTAINNLDEGRGGWEDMEALAQAEPLFAYRQRVDFYELPGVLAGFDFGLLWHHPRLSARLPLAHASNLQTKFCVHIQAGLPTLAPAELEWCAELTESLGVGLAFRHADLDRLPAMLADFDHARCQAAMATARERLGIGPHAAALADFLHRAAAAYNGVEAQPG